MVWWGSVVGWLGRWRGRGEGLSLTKLNFFSRFPSGKFGWGGGVLIVVVVTGEKQSQLLSLKT